MYQGDNESGMPVNGGTNGAHSGNGHGGAVATVRLGDYLVERGVLTPDQLTNVLDQQQARGGALLGQMLVHQGVLTEEGLARALAEIAGVPFQPLRLQMVQDAAVQAVPRDIAPRYGIVPVAIVGQTLRVSDRRPIQHPCRRRDRAPDSVARSGDVHHRDGYSQRGGSLLRWRRGAREPGDRDGRSPRRRGATCAERWRADRCRGDGHGQRVDRASRG
ncbi:MAG: hypothetical protein GKS06_05050 [Acidobacteria bacterium]|nr:hypothetical protein [Acidobacteriota bacterium]